MHFPWFEHKVKANIVTYQPLTPEHATHPVKRPVRTMLARRLRVARWKHQLVSRGRCSVMLAFAL